MSAEILRRAAVLMRERAEAATFEVPWHSPGDLIESGFDPEDADHIAFSHPAVALTVADWLDSAAYRVDVSTAAGVTRPDRHSLAALAVARAYLGESA